MDLKITFWKSKNGECRQEDDEDAIPHTKMFSSKNTNFIAGLSSAIYGTWSAADGDTVMKIEKKEGRAWIPISGEEIMDKYLSHLIVPKEEPYLEGNELCIQFEGEMAYFRRCTDKFITGLQWVQKDVAPDLKFKRLRDVV